MKAPSHPLLRSFVSSWLGSMLLLVAIGRSAQPTSADDARIGRPWTGERGVRQTEAEIREREHEFEQHGRSKSLRIKRRFGPEFETVDKDAPVPDIAPPPVAVETNPPTALAPQSVALSFTGATLAETHAYPPDSMGAVGSAQFVVCVNGRIKSFNKTNGVADGVINLDTDVFFAPVMTPPVTNNFTSDPRIRYDRLSGRWFAIMIDVPGQAGLLPNRVMFAVSDGPVVTLTNWTFFQFQHDQVSQTGDTGKFADYPTLGIDANALYIGVNVFGQRGMGQTFDNTTGFVVRKSSLLGAGPIVATALRKLISNNPSASGPYTPQGVDNFDPAATEGYFIGVDAKYYGRLKLVRVANPGGTPSVAGNITVPIPLNGPTIDVPHLGNTNGSANYLDGLDYRLLGAHLRNGRLWTAANLAVDNTGMPAPVSGVTVTRMGVRWYELQGIPTGQTPGVRQYGTVFESSTGNTTTNRSYWMGTAMVSGQGHAALGFSVAGENEYANAGTCGRLASDPTNTMQTPALYSAANTAYNPRDHNGNPVNRWGDYSYTCLDPDDDMTMWTIQEFCDTTNSYGVRVAKLLAPPPARPVSCSPSSLMQGTNNANVVITGLITNGSGFFDPGAGFARRIAAAINGGGVTVNSVTYSNPTTLRLNLSIDGNAATNARTITVTNPDGQSLTSTGALLTITPGAVLDTDGDGIPDAWELAHGLNPNDTTDAAKDFDGDGLTNLQEYLAGTDPNDSRNYLGIISVTLSDTNAEVSFTSISNKLYRVERTDDLSGGNWSTVADNVPGTGAGVTVTNLGAAPLPQCIYRVRLLP